MADVELARVLAIQLERQQRLAAALDRAAERSSTLAGPRDHSRTPSPDQRGRTRSATLPSWTDVVQANEELVAALDFAPPEALDARLSVTELEAVESLAAGRGLWLASDFVAVGLCGVVGVAATLF